MTRGRVLLFSLVLALAIAAPLALAMRSTSSVRVTEKEFKLAPTPTKASKGTVKFTVKNIGHLKHEFIVLKTNLPVGSLPVKGAKAVLVGKVYGKIPAFGPGTTKTLTVKLPAGKYILLCNLPAHYKAGQRSAFKVG